MRKGDEEHLRRVAQLEEILGPISRPNYDALSKYDTARHSTAGGIIPSGEIVDLDALYRAVEISDRTTREFLNGLERIR